MMFYYIDKAMRHHLKSIRAMAFRKIYEMDYANDLIYPANYSNINGVEIGNIKVAEITTKEFLGWYNNLRLTLDAIELVLQKTRKEVAM